MINSDEKNAAVANKKSMIDELQSKIAHEAKSNQIQSHEAKSNADELQSKIPDKSKTQPPSYGKSYGSQITSLKSMWENMNKVCGNDITNRPPWPAMARHECDPPTEPAACGGRGTRH